MRVNYLCTPKKSWKDFERDSTVWEEKKFLKNLVDIKKAPTFALPMKKGVRKYS